MTRGFTLLETVMAAALGALIVLVCTSVFGLVDRTEAAMGRRSQQVAELGIVHSAMQRAMLSMVMSPRGASVIGDDNEEDLGDPTRAGFRLVFADDTIDPRLLGEPRTVPERERLATQRLDLTLSQPPLPGLAPRRRDREDTPSTGPAVRGAFELRPTMPDELPGPRGARKDKPLGMSLWWTPVRSSSTREMVLASGLSVCQWKVFRDRERVDEFGAAYWHHLPAFVEMELETIDGIYATWLFEVDATIERPRNLGPPRAQDEPDDGTTVGDDGDAGDRNDRGDDAGADDTPEDQR